MVGIHILTGMGKFARGILWIWIEKGGGLMKAIKRERTPPWWPRREARPAHPGPGSAGGQAVQTRVYRFYWCWSLPLGTWREVTEPAVRVQGEQRGGAEQKRPTRFSVNRTQRPGGAECQGLQLCLAVCCGGWGGWGGWAGTAADKMENEFESHDLIRYHGPDALGLPESL